MRQSILIASVLVAAVALLAQRDRLTDHLAYEFRFQAAQGRPVNPAGYR
jgi:hypothetical protein